MMVDNNSPDEVYPFVAEAYSQLAIAVAEGGNSYITEDDFQAILAGACKTEDDFAADVSEWQSLRFKASMNEARLNARIAIAIQSREAADRYLSQRMSQ